jgi:O-antigen ligase
MQQRLSLRSAHQPVLLALGLVAVATAMGWAVTQHSRLYLGLPLGVALVTSVLLFAELGLSALWVWAPLSVITYPLGGPAGNITFDRVWIPGLLALLLILPRPRMRNRASTGVLLGLCVLAAVLGIRAVTTSGTQGDYADAIRIWLDSLVLTVITFAVVRRVVAVRADGAERISFSLMIAGLLLALIGIGERISGYQLAAHIKGASVFYDPAIGGVRISGPYESPAPYGLALVLCLAATIYWLRLRPRSGDARFATFTIIALDLIAIFFNYFRTGWISAVIVIVLCLGLRPRRFGRTLTTLAIVGAVLALGFAALQSTSGAVSSRIDNTQNVFARLGAYKQAIQIFEKKPVFGVGTNRYTIVASQLPPLYVNGVESVPDPHDSFLLTLAEDGVIGLLALLAASVAIWRLVRVYRRRADSHADVLFGAALTGAALAYLAYSLTLAMLPYGPSNQFFAALLGIAAGRLDYMSSAPRATPSRA